MNEKQKNFPKSYGLYLMGGGKGGGLVNLLILKWGWRWHLVMTGNMSKNSKNIVGNRGAIKQYYIMNVFPMVRIAIKELKLSQVSLIISFNPI